MIWGATSNCVVGAVMIVISTAAVGIRCWVRATIAKGFTADDWWLVAAQMLNMTGIAVWLTISIKQQKYPPGSPQSGSVEEFEELALLLIVEIGTYLIASVVLKMSVAIFFLHVTLGRWQRWLYKGSMIIYGLFLTAVLFTVLFRCEKVDPIQIMGNPDCRVKWNVIDALGHCTAISNALCDWIFALTPAYILYKTPRIRLSEKIGMYILIGLACSGSLVSVIRIAHMEGMKLEPKIFETDEIILLLTWVETTICISTIACVRLKPLLGIFKRNTNKFKANRGQRKPPRVAKPVLFDTPKMSEASDKEFVLDTSALKGIGLLPDVVSDLESGLSHSRMNSTICSDATWDSRKTWLMSIKETAEE